MADTTFHAAIHPLLAMIPARLQPFLTVSYPVWGVENGHRVQLYKKGPNDMAFVLFVTLMFTVVRHVVMTYLLTPVATHYIQMPETPADITGKNGAESPEAKRRRLRAEQKRKEHAIVRFAEQGWSMLYCILMESIGLTILSRIPNPTSPEQLWGTYPVTRIPWLTKVYYLTQLAWWFHQVYVINTEKRRSDHWQMFFHHCVTIALVTLSYLGNYTRVGTVVHTLMDIVDILLPAAKLLRYVGQKTACDIAFGLFLLGWLATRQIGLAMVTYSAYDKAPKYIAFEWNPAKQHYLTPALYWAFISLLSILLMLCSMWFFTALRIAVKVVRGEQAEDSRSDDEGAAELEEHEDDDEPLLEKPTAPAITNGSAEAKLNGHSVSTAHKANGHTHTPNGTAANGSANGHAVDSGLKRRQ